MTPVDTKFQGPGPFFKGQDLILSGNDGPTFLRGCFVACTVFHVRYCPAPPPFCLAQSGGDTTPAETTTPIRRVSAFVSRSSFLTDLVPGSHRVWSWKVHFLSQRPEIVVTVRCRYARRLTHVASCQSGCVVTRRVTSAQCSDVLEWRVRWCIQAHPSNPIHAHAPPPRGTLGQQGTHEPQVQHNSEGPSRW